MSREESNSAGADCDLLCRGPSGFLLWCAPWLVFVLGFSVSPGLRTALWQRHLPWWARRVCSTLLDAVEFTAVTRGRFSSLPVLLP